MQSKSPFHLHGDAYFQRELEIYKARAWKLPHNFFRCTTDSLSQICTTLFGMDIFNFFSAKQNSLRIHVIGASAYELACPGDWEEIMHLFPSLLEMEICCIGPDVSLFLKKEQKYTCVKAETCPACAKGRRVRNVSRYDLYHDFEKSPEFARPDLCVA